MKTVALVKELFFMSRLTEARRQLGIDLEFAESPEEVKHAGKIIIDLEAFGIESLKALRKRNPKALIIGYYSHIQVALKESARKEGCDIVLKKSEFTKKLRELLEKGL